MHDHVDGRIVSVNVGKPATLRWQGRDVRTGFIKRPTSSPVRVLAESLDGDGQADKRYHGGPEMAAYAYPAEHYDAWRSLLGLADLPWGSFGENLTIEGFEESAVRRGDEFEAGTARFRVTKPRMPCYKLNARFQRADVLKLFLHQGWPGFYLAVVRTGTVGAGDRLRRVATSAGEPTIVELFQRKAGKGSED